MLGWKHIVPNLLLKPKSFTSDISIGILDNDNFTFLDDKTNLIDSSDTLHIDVKNTTLIYSPSTIVQVVLDNTK